MYKNIQLKNLQAGGLGRLASIFQEEQDDLPSRKGSRKRKWQKTRWLTALLAVLPHLAVELCRFYTHELTPGQKPPYPVLANIIPNAPAKGKCCDSRVRHSIRSGKCWPNSGAALLGGLQHSSLQPPSRRCERKKQPLFLPHSSPFAFTLLTRAPPDAVLVEWLPSFVNGLCTCPGVKKGHEAQHRSTCVHTHKPVSAVHWHHFRACR